MKKKIVMLTAALAALTAFPVAAGAAGGSPEQWDSTDNCCTGEWWDSTTGCESYESGGTGDSTGTGWTIPETGVTGDVDCDGKVQIADAILFSRYLAEDPLVTVFTAGLHNANCNGDDALDASDLIAILRILVACDPGSEYAREMLGELTDVTAETTTADGERQDGTDDFGTCCDSTNDCERRDSTDNCCTGDWQDSTDNCEPMDTTEPAEEIPAEYYNLWVEGDSWKTVHHLLDPLDIWNAQLYGSGTDADGSTWSLNGEYTVWEACDAGLISVDTGRFDSRVPGEYTVTLYYPLKDAKGIIPVTVLPTISEDNPASKNWYGAQGGDLVFMVYEPDVKLTYRIGEELAVDNIGFYAKNDIPENDAYPEASHWDWFDIKTGDYPECLDTSEFDSTQPGIYKIRLSFPELNAEGWFEVRVVGD